MSFIRNASTLSSKHIAMIEPVLLNMIRIYNIEHSNFLEQTKCDTLIENCVYL